VPRILSGTQVAMSPAFPSSLRSRGAVADVDVDVPWGWGWPGGGDFLNDAEPDVSRRHTIIGESGEDEVGS
jgi:hypothetical protein